MLKRSVLILCASLVAFAAPSIADSSSISFIRFVDNHSLPEKVLESMLQKRQVGEYGVVIVDTDALRQMLREAFVYSGDSASPTISLPLIDGILVTVVLGGGGESHSGWQTGFASFLGKVAGDEYSTVQCLLSPDGSADLVIRTAGRRFKLEKTATLPYHLYWSLGDGISQPID